jgi:hypothetical protein
MSDAAVRAGAAERDLVLGGVEAQPVTEAVDRLLELRIVERDQDAALVADHVVMVVLVIEMCALIAGHTVPDIDPGDQVQAVQQV